jgi:hypothetical protein
MIPGVYVQTPEEVLAHPEYIEQNNQWMDMFLTQLDMMDRKGDLSWIKQEFRIID